jgi:hypothetical protein
VVLPATEVTAAPDDLNLLDVRQTVCFPFHDGHQGGVTGDGTAAVMG